MEIKCTVEELLKMVSASFTDTIEIKEPTIVKTKELTSELSKLNQQKRR